VSNVTLRIGGRGFQIACAPGEEAHIQDLARMIDDKLSTFGGAASQSESRMLLFAALMLADELHEQPPVPAPGPAPDKRGESWRLAEIADRLENLASELEAAAAGD
jgi:cell division protein ZapA